MMFTEFSGSPIATVDEAHSTFGAPPGSGMPIDDRDAGEIWAQRGNAYVRLRIKEIERVESERDYVHLHNSDRAYLLRATLKSVHQWLGKERYLRIRRSAIIRIDRIVSIRDHGYGDIQILLRSGAAMRVGRTYLKSIRQRLKHRSGRYPMPRTTSPAP